VHFESLGAFIVAHVAFWIIRPI